MYPEDDRCTLVNVPGYDSGAPVADQSRHRPVRKPTPPAQRIGYARTQPDQDDLRQAVVELRQLDVTSQLVFTDRGSNARGADRGELQAAIAAAQPGDVLVVARLARLARSHHDLAAILEVLDGHRIALQVGGQRLEEISGPTMVRLTAQFQAELITEAIAEHNRYRVRRRDPRGASPALPPLVWLQVRELFDAGWPRDRLATLFKVSRPTIFRIAGKPPQSSHSAVTDPNRRSPS